MLIDKRVIGPDPYLRLELMHERQRALARELELRRLVPSRADARHALAGRLLAALRRRARAAGELPRAGRPLRWPG